MMNWLKVVALIGSVVICVILVLGTIVAITGYFWRLL